MDKLDDKSIECIVKQVLDGRINPFYKTYVLRVEGNRTIAYDAYNEEEARLQALYNHHLVKELVKVEIPTFNGYNYLEVMHIAKERGIYSGDLNGTM